MSFREELSRYNEWTCPDYLYDAWRVLFANYQPQNAQELLRWAEIDLQERKDTCTQRVFNANRRSNSKWEKAKFNW